MRRDQFPAMAFSAHPTRTTAIGNLITSSMRNKTHQSMLTPHPHAPYPLYTDTLIPDWPYSPSLYSVTITSCSYPNNAISTPLMSRMKVYKVGRVMGSYWPLCNGTSMLLLIYGGGWRYILCWHGRCASHPILLLDVCRISIRLPSTLTQRHL